MKVVQATIHSDLRKDGQVYQASDEVEQELTIAANGTVVLHAISHEGLPCWQEERKINKTVCQDVLSLLNRYADDSVSMEPEQWKMVLIYEDGSRAERFGPMTGSVFAGDVDLTRYIREHIPFMSLGVFAKTDSL